MRRKVTITLESEDGSMDMLTNVDIDPPVREDEMENIENIAIAVAGEFFDWLQEEAEPVDENGCVCAPEPSDMECECGAKPLPLYY